MIFDTIYLLLVFLAIGIAIGGFINLGIDWYRDYKSPIISIAAKVIQLRIQSETNVRYVENIHYPHTETFYFVTFQFENGEVHEFGVTRSLYDALSQGRTGTLTYKGTRLKDFTPDPE